jgi:hypothetical protein
MFFISEEQQLEKNCWVNQESTILNQQATQINSVRQDYFSEK